jgi:hypothetical protein
MWKRHAIGFAGCLVLLAQPGTAFAQTSANYVMTGCRELSKEAGTAPVLQGHCGGVVDAILSFGPLLGVCAPKGATAAQGVKVVTLYIDQRPERMHEGFANLAREALQQAWPCGR